MGQQKRPWLTCWGLPGRDQAANIIQLTDRFQHTTHFATVLYQQQYSMYEGLKQDSDRLFQGSPSYDGYTVLAKQALLAMTYSRRGLRSNYHRRWGA